MPVFLLALLLIAPAPQEGKVGKPAKFQLTAAAFRKGQFRPGYDFEADPPLKGWKATVGTELFLFLDMDGDGTLAVEKDGLALPTAPFVVPIPAVLLIKSGQFDVGFEGTKTLILTWQDLGKWQPLIPDMALLTTLRIQAGVRPARFDSTASSHCEKHCDYLNLNGLADGKSGMGMHKEDPKKKGYTPEGAAAAAGSDISPGTDDPKSALLGWYKTVWHGAPMIASGLKTVGFALKHRVALLYFFEEEFAERHQLHPADGATQVFCDFDNAGELPNPVPKSDNGKGCGFPIYVILGRDSSELTSAKVTDGTGRPVKGTQSCPVRPANPEWPTNSGCAAFIPSRPLVANSIYKVRFEFKDSPPLEWSFTTGR